MLNRGPLGAVPGGHCVVRAGPRLVLRHLSGDLGAGATVIRMNFSHRARGPHPVNFGSRATTEPPSCAPSLGWDVWATMTVSAGDGRREPSWRQVVAGGRGPVPCWGRSNDH